MRDRDQVPIHGFRQTQWCEGAAKSDGKQLGGAQSEMHKHCPVAIRTSKPMRSAGNNQTVGAAAMLLICTCSCHIDRPNQKDPDPRCLLCGNMVDGEVDTDRWLCIDEELCSTRVQIRTEQNPATAVLRQAQADGEAARAAKRAQRGNQMTENAPGTQPARTPREAKPKVGKCQHCGEPTKGGQFVAGHDAKLKGQLQRVAIDQAAKSTDRIDAITEQLIRGWHKGSYPDALVKNIKGSGDTDEAKAASQREQREKAVAAYEQLRTTAENKAKDSSILDRLVKARIG